MNRPSPGERQAPSLAGRRRLRSVGSVAGGLRGGSPAFIRGFPQGTEALEPPTALRGSRRRDADFLVRTQPWAGVSPPRGLEGEGGWPACCGPGMGRRGREREELWRPPATAAAARRRRRSRLAGGDASCGGLWVESPGGAPPLQKGWGLPECEGQVRGFPGRVTHSVCGGWGVLAMVSGG